jgi:hypothetical protein
MNPKIDGTNIAPSISIRNTDSNEDGKIDQINLKIMANIDPAKLRSVAILQQFSYEISSQVLADIKLSTHNFI